jgi:hypothetical protein
MEIVKKKKKGLLLQDKNYYYTAFSLLINPLKDVELDADLVIESVDGNDKHQITSSKKKKIKKKNFKF